MSAAQTTYKPFAFSMPTPCLLDRLADAELQLGHHVRAEQLAARAAELREALETRHGGAH